MQAWVIGIIGAGVGLGASKGFDAIGWWVKNIVQRRRDAAHVAKKIYDSTKKIGGEETQGIREIEKANVERYGRIYRQLQAELRKKD